MPDRNTELHFGNIPVVDIQRSKFKINNDHKLTMNTGDLIPIYQSEILPGDTVKMKLSSLIRMTTPIDPVMDNAYCDFYWFFVPNRLTWDHWEEFMGENKTSYWAQPEEYQIPWVNVGEETAWRKGDVADYMGMPIGVHNIGMSALYFRAYALIYREWFRSENLQEPPAVSTDVSTDVSITNVSTQLDDSIVGAELGGKPLKVTKYADYFTTALPSPQKGEDVYLPLGNTAPIVTGEVNEDLKVPAEPMRLVNANSGIANWETLRVVQTYGIGGGEGNEGITTIGTSTSSVGPSANVMPGNLYADLSVAEAATVNQLRQAFAVQRLLEKDARGGTRYRELIKSHFLVTTADARMQVPEYLGGKRVPINMTQVIQNSATDAVSPQGNTAAYSLTIDSDDHFTHSFTEHGILMCVAAIRTDHTYQQGINRQLTRRNRLDYYFPTLANIGEQYIKNKEIYAQGTDADDEAFGYQEAWAEYRYIPSRISGELRSTYETPLDSWHYGDYYTEQPVLGSEWIQETDVNVARTLAIQSQDQFIADFYFEGIYTRPMPVYSVPGLIDHH